MKVKKLIKIKHIKANKRKFGSVHINLDPSQFHRRKILRYKIGLYIVIKGPNSQENTMIHKVPKLEHCMRYKTKRNVQRNRLVHYYTCQLQHKSISI